MKCGQPAPLRLSSAVFRLSRFSLASSASLAVKLFKLLAGWRKAVERAMSRDSTGQAPSVRHVLEFALQQRKTAPGDGVHGADSVICGGAFAPGSTGLNT